MIRFLEGVRTRAGLSAVLVRVFGAIVMLIERRRAGLIVAIVLDNVVGSTRGRGMQLPQTRFDGDRRPARGRREGDHTRRVGIVDDETVVHLRSDRADSV